jgi:SAM-dependent MidA family methyltransferase
MRFADRLTFRDFVDRALYDEREGFYGSGRVRFGAAGDFATSSTTHPVFGETIAAWARHEWDACGRPSQFAIVEVGPGDGRAAAAIADALGQRGGAPEWRLVLVERSATLAARQRERLAGAAIPVRWTSLDALAAAPVDGVVVSNEVVDALPFHRARVRDGAVEEQYVAETGGRLVAVWDAPSTDAIGRYLERYAPWLFEPGVSQEVEVCLDAIEWMRSVARAIGRGAALTLDYGDTADRLYARGRPFGTMRAGGAGRLADPLDAPGTNDITASVNFTALVDAGREQGLELATLEPQIELLCRFGLAERVAARLETASAAERVAMKALLVPAGPGGGVRALVQRRRSAGLAGDRAAADTATGIGKRPARV